MDDARGKVKLLASGHPTQRALRLIYTTTLSLSQFIPVISAILSSAQSASPEEFPGYAKSVVWHAQ
jgi:hypothetical protein